MWEKWGIGEFGYESTKLEDALYNLTTLNFTWNLVTIDLGSMGNVGNVNRIRGLSLNVTNWITGTTPRSIQYIGNTWNTTEFYGNSLVLNYTE